jgi:outer membrane protein assembly factor BamD
MARRFMTSRLLPLGCVLALAASCATAPPVEMDFADIPSAEQLYREGLDHLQPKRSFIFFKTREYDEAIESFQDVIDNYPYSDYAVLAELKIADAYFEQDKYEEALSYYRDFGDLHPDHEQVPYTIYRSALCFYEQSYGPNRDQTATEQSLVQLDRLLDRYPYSTHAREAEGMWRELRERLARHSMMIGDFYMDREEYQSAADRYRSVLNEYPGLGLDAQALYKLGLCYNRMRLEDEAARIFQVLLEDYEGTDVAREAADLIPAAQ